MFGPIRLGRPGRRTIIDVAEVSIALQRLPQAFDGFRIVLAADLHYGQLVGEPFIRRVMELIARQGADLVLLGGDLIDRSGRYTRRLTDMLRRRPWELPTYAILGNHDAHFGGSEFRRRMRAAGIDLLINEHRLIGRDGMPADGRADAIALVGMDELRWGRPDCAAATAGIGEETFTLVACHNPDYADMAELAGADLMLAGHTHGGQVAPFGVALRTRTRNRSYARGWVRGPNFPVYVSRGLGVAGIPLRIGCDPELPVITLRTAHT